MYTGCVPKILLTNVCHFFVIKSKVKLLLSIPKKVYTKWFLLQFLHSPNQCMPFFCNEIKSETLTVKTQKSLYQVVFASIFAFHVLQLTSSLLIQFKVKSS